ncbi:MAG: sigma-70 family RNA polymerase sigma factor [Planctomycetes bacterium]|nr:sigma-70 family RNA polymerase sigma factor [Planctomycetota bacterium]
MSLTGAAQLPLEPLTSRAADSSAECSGSGRAAFESAFDRCAASLHRYFSVRAGDTHLADDFMQQLWLQASAACDGIPAANIEYWLRAIARNLLLTHWRVRARRGVNAPIADPEFAAGLADRLCSEDLPADEIERREVRDQLLLAITELPAAEQELIVGCYFEQTPHVALAARLGITERAVEGRLYRARSALRERLRNLEG